MAIFISWVLVIFSLVFFLVFFLTFVIGLFFAPPISTSEEVLSEITDRIDLPKSSHFIDLGCGSGDVVFKLYKKYPYNRLDGIEISPLHYIFCLLRKVSLGNKRRLKIIYGSILNKKLAKYDRIYCYLLPKTMEQVAEKLSNEVSNEAKIFSYVFKFEGIEPAEVVTLSNGKHLNIYKGSQFLLK